MKFALKDVIDDLAKWARSNGIEVVSLSTNNDSQNFKKRFDEYGFRYVEQKQLPKYHAEWKLDKTMCPTSVTFSEEIVEKKDDDE